MTYDQSKKSWKIRWAGFGILAVVLLAWGGAGCSRWNLRGEGFEDQSMSNSIRQTRKGGHTPEFWGFSNKAREINDDFAE
jgi:hypothetical protein